MADDIRQEFVFDAAKALKTLEMLTSRYEKLNTVLRTHAKTVKGINTSTRKITGSLLQIKNAAKAAADQLQRVYGAKATAATTKAAKGSGAPPVDTGKVDQAKASLKELDAVARKTFAGAPIKNQKAFNRGLNELVAAFHRSGGSVADFRTKLKLLDSQVNGTQARMRTAMRNIAKSTKDATKTDSLRNFTVSWQTMVRIVTTQLIVRSLNVLRQALRDALNEALEFSRSVAEVGTIANDAFGGLEDIATIVRTTSDEFGKGRLDVAEGLYQTLSNQVGTAAESLEVFKTANKLSIAAVGSTEDAVNLLTAALNGFDISVTQADTVAAKLFKTVELGRTRMSELANTLGRVGPLANALGISLDETLAAIATITVQGTKSAEALTQLRGVMQGMIKPSEDMKKIFQEIGVANAEAGIATYGFQGFLNEMTKITGKSTSEMGKLIRRVRGLLGAVTLASEDTEKFVENLQKIEDTTSTLLSQKYKLVFETPGEELLREFNKLKNVLVVDIGRSLVELTLTTVKFSQALVAAAPSLKALGLIIGAALIPRLAQYAALLGVVILRHWTIAAGSVKIMAPLVGRWLALTTVVKGYVAALGLANLAMGGIAIVLAGAFFALDRYNKAQQEAIGLANKLATAQNKYQETLDTKTIETYTKLERKRAEIQRRQILGNLAEAQKAYNEGRNIAKETDKAIVDSAKSRFSVLSDLLSKYVSDYQKKVDDLNSSREDSEQRVDGVIRSSEQDRYDRSIRFLGAQQKLDAQRARGLQLQKEASRYLITGDPDKIKRGLDLYKEAGKIFDDIRDIAYDQLGPLEEAWRAGKLSADQFNNLQRARRADNAAHQLGVNLSAEQLKAERALQQVLDDRAAKAKADLEHQKALNADLKTQFDIVLNNMKMLDKEGKILDDKILKDQTEARGRAFEQIRDLASKTIGGLDLADQLQLTALKLEVEKAFSPASIQLEEDTLNTASKQVEAAFLKGMNAASSAWAVSGAIKLGEALIPDFDPTRGFGELQATVSNITDKDFSALKDKQDEIESKQAQINGLIRQVGVEWKSALDTGAPLAFTDLYSSQAALILKNINLLKGAQKIDAKGISLIQEQIDKYRTLKATLPGGAVTGEGFGSSTIEAFALQAEKALQLVAATGAARNDLEALDAEFTRLGGKGKQAAIDSLLNQAANGRLNVLQSGTQELQKQLGIVQNQQFQAEQRITDQYKQRRDYAKEIAMIQAAYVAAPGIIQKQAQAEVLRPQGLAKGGLVRSLMYLAKGNLARGTDTIPAMLSPGEFVMNSKSTRRFYSQLVAMNRGQTPIYREAGGPVTNVSVGDVHVQGGKNPAQTGRQIVGAIKRELRRGTSSF